MWVCSEKNVRTRRGDQTKKLEGTGEKTPKVSKRKNQLKEKAIPQAHHGGSQNKITGKSIEEKLLKKQENTKRETQEVKVKKSAPTGVPKRGSKKRRGRTHTFTALNPSVRKRGIDFASQ